MPENAQFFSGYDKERALLLEELKKAAREVGIDPDAGGRKISPAQRKKLEKMRRIELACVHPQPYSI